MRSDEVQQPSCAVSEPMASPDGSFSGVALTTIDVAYFLQLYCAFRRCS